MHGVTNQPDNSDWDTPEVVAIRHSMGTLRAEYEALVQHAREQGARNAHVDPILLAAADAYDAAEAQGSPSLEQLQIIVDAASHPLARIWMDGIRILMRASGWWDEAAQAILIMSKNSKTQVRFNAICVLGPKTPDAILDTVLKAGLTDRSTRVRWKAADRAASLRQFHLEPEIEAALAAEQNTKTRHSIAHDLQRLGEKRGTESNFP